jgi:hypothetical protein
MATPTTHPPAGAPHPADLQVLAAWSSELADTFVALACDIALVIDGGGRIVKLAQHLTHPIAPASWIGGEWVQTAGPDSRSKIVQMLADVAATGHARRREINHPDALGGPTPVAYRAARLGKTGPMLAVGQDLRPQAALQQRFVAAQEALERSYWNAQPRAPGAADAPALLTRAERDSLGLSAEALDPDGIELVRALGQLVERIGHAARPRLLCDARRLAERYFLARALERAGSQEALKASLVVKRRSTARRKGS